MQYFFYVDCSFAVVEVVLEDDVLVQAHVQAVRLAQP